MPGILGVCRAVTYFGSILGIKAALTTIVLCSFNPEVLGSAGIGSKGLCGGGRCAFAGGTPGSRPPDNQAQGHRPPQVAPATAIRGKVREEGGHGLLRGEAARTPLTTVRNGPQMKGWVLEKRPPVCQ